MLKATLSILTVKQVTPDPSWVEYEGTEYKLVTSSALDMEDAQLYCQAEQSGLLEINSAEEHNLILYLTKRRIHEQTLGTPDFLIGEWCKCSKLCSTRVFYTVFMTSLLVLQICSSLLYI